MAEKEELDLGSAIKVQQAVVKEAESNLGVEHERLEILELIQSAHEVIAEVADRKRELAATQKKQATASAELAATESKLGEVRAELSRVETELKVVPERIKRETAELQKKYDALNDSFEAFKAKALRGDPAAA